MASVRHPVVSGRQITADDYDDEHIVELDAADVTGALGYTPADATHNHDERYYTQGEVDALLALLQPLPLTANFTDDAEMRFRADVAMTLTQQGTSGTGSVAYEKSTAAAPTVFSSTTSPISLEAGAWLKVVATGVTDLYAVALKRTA